MIAIPKRAGLIVVAASVLSACAPAADFARSQTSQPSGHAATIAPQAAAPPGACAGLSGLFLPPTSVEPSMVVTSVVGQAAPVLPGVAVAVRPAAAPHFEWTQVENASVRGLSTTFGRRDPSVIVSERPAQIFELVETVSTFRSDADASLWFERWPGVSALAPQALVPGLSRSAYPPLAALGQADEAVVTIWTRPGVDMPSDIQYLIRTRNTVVTLELIGGASVTDMSTAGFAHGALARVVSRCGGSAAS